MGPLAAVEIDSLVATGGERADNRRFTGARHASNEHALHRAGVLSGRGRRQLGPQGTQDGFDILFSHETHMPDTEDPAFEPVLAAAYDHAVPLPQSAQ